MFNKISIIVNPAAGQPQPIFETLEQVLGTRADLEWSTVTTQKDGDGRRFAQDAIRAGVDLVVAYGGDGTVKDVMNGLIGGHVPLAILPGGTGNALAHELHIPMDLNEAIALLFDGYSLQPLDVGKVAKDGKNAHFLLRAGVGLITDIVTEASREDKDKFGNLAYVIASLKTLVSAEPLTFSLMVDQQPIEEQGLTCIVANSAAVGAFQFAPDVSFCDGLLDVFIFDGKFKSILETVASNVKLTSFSQRWQGREVQLQVQPPCPLVIDGEEFGYTPVTISVLPQAVRVLVPVEK